MTRRIEGDPPNAGVRGLPFFGETGVATDEDERDRADRSANDIDACRGGGRRGDIGDIRGDDALRSCLSRRSFSAKRFRRAYCVYPMTAQMASSAPAGYDMIAPIPTPAEFPLTIESGAAIAPTDGVETTARSLLTAPAVSLIPTARTATMRTAASATPVSLSRADTVVFLRYAQREERERDVSIADASDFAVAATLAPAAATASDAALPGAVAVVSAAKAAASGPLAHTLEDTATVDVTVCATLPVSASRTFKPSGESVGVTVSDTNSPFTVVPVADQESTPAVVD